MIETSAVHSLSKKELEVYKLLIKGLSNQDIAKKLKVAISTVKCHNTKIFSKCGVTNRTALVAKALTA